MSLLFQECDMSSELVPNIHFFAAIEDCKKMMGNKWFDEVLKSFGAFHIYDQYLARDSRLVDGFCKVANKPYSIINSELKERAAFAERIISKMENRPYLEQVFDNFKQVVFETLTNDLPITYNKEELVSDKHLLSKPCVFKKEDEISASDCIVNAIANVSLLLNEEHTLSP